MADHLEPCDGCSRHVRGSERACPFCGAALTPRARVEELRLLTRLDRGTLVAIGAALSAAGIAIGCREAAPVAIYGAPAPVEQTQPSAPSAAPPASAAPSEPLPSVAAPAESPPEPPATASARPSPKPPTTASARPSAPAAAYGAPPSMRLEPEIAPAPTSPKK